MTRINVEIDAATLQRLVVDHLNQMFNGEIKPEDVKIEVKSKQNYRAEWEQADMRAVVSKVEHE